MYETWKVVDDRYLFFCGQTFIFTALTELLVFSVRVK